MDQHNGTPLEKPKQSGFQILVGAPWPGEVHVETSEERPRLAFGLCVLLAALLVAYAIYGMVTSDYRIHQMVLEIVRPGARSLRGLGLWEERAVSHFLEPPSDSMGLGGRHHPMASEGVYAYRPRR